MDGTAARPAAVGPNPGPSWHVEGSRRFQRRRQGRHPVAERQWPGRDLADERRRSIAAAAVELQSGPELAVKDAGDFNGDGKADILWQNDNGQAAIWLMDGTDVLAQSAVGSNPGPSWHIKAPLISTVTARATSSGRTTMVRRRSG